MKIKILKSATADTRTCDFANVTKEQLEASSVSHIKDVYMGLRHVQEQLEERAKLHDWDKLENLEGFHSDFVGGFKSTEWWDNHRIINRHHINMEDGVRKDVNLVDVLEHIVDCVMASMARGGDFFDVELSNELLQKAVKHTVEELRNSIEVVE